MIKASELKPGHIIQRGSGADGRIVVLSISAWDGSLAVRCATLSDVGGIHTLTVRENDMVEIEQPQLTPAQQRADGVIALLRQGVAQSASIFKPLPPPPWVSAARQLLDEIDPPAPPTLEEALQALIDAENWLAVDPECYENGPETSAKVGKNAAEIINRARRAGIIK